MKKVYSLLIAFIATTFIMYSQSYYYDSFDYPVGNLGLSTGPVIPAVNPATSSSTGNWNYGSTKSAKVQVGSLTYPGLLTSVTSLNDINLVNTGSAVDERMVLTATTITTPVYFSFIMKVKAVPAASTRLASLRGTTKDNCAELHLGGVGRTVSGVCRRCILEGGRSGDHPATTPKVLKLVPI
jgi:hypothetical protein